jgi:hypothetical protein
VYLGVPWCAWACRFEWQQVVLVCPVFSWDPAAWSRVVRFRRGLLYVVRCLFFAVCFFVAGWLVFVVCCLLCVVCCLLLVRWCLLFVVCCVFLLVVACCLLLVVCDVLHISFPKTSRAQ